MVRRDHARVARMELAGEPFVVERALQRVDAVGDEQRRPFLALGEEVAHRPIHRPRHADGEAVDGDERERAVDRADGRRVAAEHAAPRLLDVERCADGSGADRADRRRVRPVGASAYSDREIRLSRAANSSSYQLSALSFQLVQQVSTGTKYSLLTAES